jgi:ABC-type Zn uptake system ZnuABC Zn-binding protein ZnuA
VLDTLEGLSQAEMDAGEDYVTIMQRNLEALTQGLTAP